MGRVRLDGDAVARQDHDAQNPWGRGSRGEALGARTSGEAHVPRRLGGAQISMQVVATHRARQPGAPLWALILFSVSSTMFAWSACGKGRVRRTSGCAHASWRHPHRAKLGARPLPRSATYPNARGRAPGCQRASNSPSLRRNRGCLAKPAYGPLE